MKKKIVKKRRGNCYATCEALYHLLGGKKNGWGVETVRHEGDVHWYLTLNVRYPTPNGARMMQLIIDPTEKQFKVAPPYHAGRGRGFLTREPSRRARELMDRLLWQER